MNISLEKYPTFVKMEVTGLKFFFLNDIFAPKTLSTWMSQGNKPPFNIVFLIYLEIWLYLYASHISWLPIEFPFVRIEMYKGTTP